MYSIVSWHMVQLGLVAKPLLTRFSLVITTRWRTIQRKVFIFCTALSFHMSFYLSWTIDGLSPYSTFIADYTKNNPELVFPQNKSSWIPTSGYTCITQIRSRISRARRASKPSHRRPDPGCQCSVTVRFWPIIGTGRSAISIKGCSNAHLWCQKSVYCPFPKECIMPLSRINLFSEIRFHTFDWLRLTIYISTASSL